MISLERWKNLSLRDQIGHIGSEIKRAILAKNRNSFFQIIETALALVDLSLSDSRWRTNSLPLLVLRQELAKAYTGQIDLENIYKAL